MWMAFAALKSGYLIQICGFVFKCLIKQDHQNYTKPLQKVILKIQYIQGARSTHITCSYILHVSL